MGVLLLLHSGCSLAGTGKVHSVEYKVRFEPALGEAHVTITVPNASWLRTLSFDLKDRRLSRFKVPNGLLSFEPGRVTWNPKKHGDQLSYIVSVAEPKGSSHGAWIDSQGVVMRMEDLLPPFSSRFKKGHKAKATLVVELPKGWTSVNAGYKRLSEHSFRVSSKRSVPPLLGWMIAGKDLNTRHEKLGQTRITVSGFQRDNIQPMPVLMFIGVIWPELEKLGVKLPGKLAVVRAGDPMWRGGLSAPNSLFLHADRPLVSENGTSTLVHELMHWALRIKSGDEGDWIVEGLAEYYSVELIYRAGGYTSARKQKVMSQLKTWGGTVKVVLGQNSQGAHTAKAVSLFVQLDEEIQRITHGADSLDTLVRELANKKVNLVVLKKAFRAVTGESSKVLGGVKVD